MMMLMKALKSKSYVIETVMNLRPVRPFAPQDFELRIVSFRPGLSFRG